MLYRPLSFRKTAFALTTVAALAGVSVLSSFPANAQQATTTSWTRPDTSTVTLDTDCRTFQPGVLGASHYCEIQKGKLLDARGAAADARGAAADARGAAADARAELAQASGVCIDEITKKILAAKKSGPLSPDQKAQFKAQIERCNNS